jgi:PAS domain S-box-containing protein
MTEAKQQDTEEGLNLDYLQHFLDASPNGVMIFDALQDERGQILDFEWRLANLQSSVFLGRTKDSFAGRRYLEELRGDEARRVFNIALEAMENHQAYNCESSLDTGLWFLITLSRLNKSLVMTLKDISEQQVQRIEIENKAEELDRFFNLSLELLAIANTDGYFLKLNKQWEEVLGYPLEEIEGKRFLDFIHPDDLPATLEAIDTLDAQNPVLSFTNRYRAKDGSYRYLEWRSRPHGKLIYAAARDISNQIIADEKLRESLRRFRALFEQSNDAVLLLDLEGQHVAVNQKAAEMLGYTVEELVAIHSTDVSAEPEKTREAFKRLLSGERIAPYERLLRRKNGSIFPVEMNIQLTHDDYGNAVGIQAIARDISTRKQNELKLYESEARFRALFEQSNDAVFILDLEARHQLANYKASELLGYTMEEMQTLSAADLSAEPEKSENVLARLLAGEHIQPYERLFRHKDGSIIPVEINVELVRDKQSQAWHLQSVVRDIRERKKAEVELQAKIEEELLFQHYLKRLQDIVIELSSIHDLDTFYKRAVELGLEAFGFERLGFLLYEPENSLAIGTYGTDIKGKLLAEHHLRFDPATLTGILERAMQREEHFVFDPDTELYSNMKVFGRGSNAAAVLWNGRDKLGWLAIDNGVEHQAISQAQLEILALYALSLGSLLAQKQTQFVLEESEARYRSVVQMMAEGVVLQDSGGRILTCNAAAERILGVAAEEMIGFSMFDPLWRTVREDGSEMDRENHPTSHTLRTGESLENVVMGVYKPGGELLWIMLNSQPLIAPNESSPYAVVFTFVDITRRKNSERQALELQLEKERIKVLTNFIQGSSHEFRTPLAIIKSSAYLLKKLDDPVRREQKVLLIEEQIERITGLLAMLMKMSQLDSDVLLPMKMVAIVPLLDYILVRLHPELERKDIRLNLTSLDVSVFANVDYLSEAIYQVLHNAIQFSPKQGVIQISCSLDENRLCIAIDDAGKGIPPEVLPHIFERFYRQDAVHSTVGFGLGLSLAQNVIEKHGGEIKVVTEDGKGSRFELWLPLV